MSSENSLYGGNWAVHAITNHSSASYAWHDTEIHRFKVVYIKKIIVLRMKETHVIHLKPHHYTVYNYISLHLENCIKHPLIALWVSEHCFYMSIMG